MFFTMVVAGILGLIYLGLTLRIIILRNKLGAAFGAGKNDELEISIRVHGNFSEYVPLCLLLIYFTERHTAIRGCRIYSRNYAFSW